MLCKERNRTLFFAGKATFVVFPYDFFAEEQEIQVLQWLIKDKARFLRGHYGNKSEQPKIQTALTPNKEIEVNVCLKLFQQQDNDQEKQEVEYHLKESYGFLPQQHGFSLNLSIKHPKIDRIRKNGS